MTKGSTFISERLSSATVAGMRRRGLWRNRLVDSVLAEAARAGGEQVAVVAGGRRITYADLNAVVDRFAGCLQAHGVSKGEVVSFQLPNRIEAMVAHQGIIRAGAISNPIVPIYRASEVEYIVRQTGSRIVVTSSNYRNFCYAQMYADLATRGLGLEHIWIVDGDGPSSLEALMQSDWEQTFEPPDRTGTDPVLLLYTSGTTALPKGVIHTHDTLDYENRSIIDLYGLTSDDVIFMPSPVTHITGVLYGLQLGPMLGTKTVLQDRWDPAVALDLILNESCTFTVSATPFLKMLNDEARRRAINATPLRIFACGGAPVPPDLVNDASANLDCVVSRVYGSTEYPTLTASANDDALEKRTTTDGRAIAAAELRIVDELGRDVRASEVGEILVRGPEMFVGYLGQEKSPFDADGWFATGDLASLDSEGFITIVGRKKDIIIRGGENISVREIEDLLFSHPYIQDVAVVGMPDRILGEKACAFVVLETAKELELSDLVAFLDGHQVARQKYPERLVVVAELPKTASGKVQKFKLRERLQRDALANP